MRDMDQATWLRIVGHKKAKEIWYLCRQYDAQEALEMGLVNTVVPLDQLEKETVKWCEEMLEKSPTALRFLKAAFNADTDGLAGFNNLLAMLHCFTIQRKRQKKEEMLSKRSASLTSVNSQGFLDFNFMHTA